MPQPVQRPADGDPPSGPAGGLPPAASTPVRALPADAILEVPLRLLGRTVKRTRTALAALQPGQVLALHTDDP